MGGGAEEKGGSIYLHCDPTASHYLKLLMDEVFGKENFRNEITWERTRGRSDASHWGNTTDILLFYSKTDDYRWQNVYRQRQAGAKPTIGDLTGAGTRNGVSGEPWQGYDPTLFGRHWAVPRNSLFAQWIDENVIEGYLQMEHPHERLNALDEAGMLVWSDNGRPSLVRPTEASAGAKVNNLWNDITRATNRERTGYPTQKPLALLERIIKASSNPGDMVLDPFCGCATTCVAAEKLDRQWVGIDISEKAAELVKERIKNELGLLLFNPIHRTDVPGDRGGKRSRDIKNVLYGKQEGMCGGCGHWYRIKDFEVDHIIPTSKGGANRDENLQLLCGNCNRIKGDKSQEYLISRVRSMAG